MRAFSFFLMVLLAGCGLSNSNPQPSRTTSAPSNTPSNTPSNAPSNPSNSAGRPDLVITQIQASPPYLYVKYKNIGTAVSNDDFLISIAANGLSDGGNDFYRFKIPAPGVETSTGGFTLGIIGLSPGDTAEVTAEIDWEGRVQEQNEANNSLTVTVTVPLN